MDSERALHLEQPITLKEEAEYKSGLWAEADARNG